MNIHERRHYLEGKLDRTSQEDMELVYMDLRKRQDKNLSLGLVIGCKGHGLRLLQVVLAKSQISSKAVESQIKNHF